MEEEAGANVFGAIVAVLRQTFSSEEQVRASIHKAESALASGTNCPASLLSELRRNLDATIVK